MFFLVILNQLLQGKNALENYNVSMLSSYPNEVQNLIILKWKKCKLKLWKSLLYSTYINNNTVGDHSVCWLLPVLTALLHLNLG